MLSIKYLRKIFRKTNISNPLICTRTCAYQGVRNVSFSGNFAYVLNGWPLLPYSYLRKSVSVSIVILFFYINFLIRFCKTLKSVRADEVVAILVQTMKQSFNSMHVSKDLTGTNVIIKIVGLRLFFMEYFTSLVFSNYFSKLLKKYWISKAAISLRSFEFTGFHLFQIMNFISTHIMDNLL